MDSKRIIRIVFDLLLVGIVVYVLYSVLKDKPLGDYGMAFLNVAEVVVGLGILIFVHELGHFLAAKACNVRVEAFSIGFGPAIPGCEVRYGETLYKIGRFPIGGYVKMLGQTDPGEKEEDEVAAREDPRSYLNKTVGQRMIIISAGVVMNVLLGMACFVYVYLAGKVEKVPRFGGIEPGSPAQMAGLQAGSKLLQVDDNPEPIYEDLFFASLLAKPGSTPVYLKWQTPDGQVHDANVIPIKGPKDQKPRLGVGFPDGLQIARGMKDSSKVTVAGSPAAKAGFQSGDRLAGVRKKGDKEFTPLKNGWDLVQAEEKWRRDPIEFQVSRDDAETTVTVEPAHFRTVGLQMEMGPIRTVPEYAYAPAAARKFAVGDVIVAVNGEREFDPLRLPDMLRDLAEAGKDAEVAVRRGQEEVAIVIPRTDLVGRGTWLESSPSRTLGSMAIPALGIAYDVLPRVAKAEAAAVAAGLQPGDEIASVTLYTSPEREPVKFKMPRDNWSSAFWALQMEVEAKVDLTYLRKGEEKSATLTAQTDATWPFAFRGYKVEFDTQTYKADSFPKAIQLGFRETYRFIARMYMSLKSLIVGDVSWANTSGPVGIVTITYKTAEQGITELVLFLGIISINLAVVNFLPIPILDGGHMVFLLWEKIRGRPAGERAMAIANTVGLLVIVSLMIFVLFLDLGGRKWIFGD